MFPRLRQVVVHQAPMAYLEQGEGDPIVFLHGNPTSSYLWRNIVPHLSRLGRCIAPDLIGMGRSGKPDLEYRFVDHARYLDGLFSALELSRITLVLHDWGSALGFDWAMRHPERIRGLAFMEAFLGPIPSWDALPARSRELFRSLRTPGVGERLVLEQNLFVEQVLPRSVLRALTEEEMAQYRAPFPDPASRKPTLAWPREIPIAGEPADVAAVMTSYRAALCRSPIPKLLFAVAPGVLITADQVAWCRTNLSNLEVVELGPGLHFLQEDHPEAIGRALADWFGRLHR